MSHEALLLDVGYVIIDVDVAGRRRLLGRATGRSTPNCSPASRRPSRGTPLPWRPASTVSSGSSCPGADTVPDEMIDPASITLLRDAGAAGRRTGVLVERRLHVHRA